MTDTTKAFELIEQQHSQLDQLFSLLNQETDILKVNDIDALVEVAQQKQVLLEDIQTLDQTIGTSPSFKAAKEQGLLDEVLANVESLLAQCKSINEINGKVIAQSQSAIDRLKSALMNNRGKASMTYDAKGQLNAGLSSVGIKA